MKQTVKFLLIAIFLMSVSAVYSQLPSLAIAGGPTIGFHMPKIDKLNESLKLNGFPELPKTMLTMGGQGFVDLPLDEWDGYLRLSGFGNGFTTYKDSKFRDTLTRSVKFSMGVGGVAAEYVRPVTKALDIYFGLQLSLGSLSLDVYQYDKSHGVWMRSFSGDTGDTMNITRNYRLTFYSGQPQLGLGLLVTKLVYLKLNVGYMFSVNGKWKVDDNVEVRNEPSGIKADGLNVSLGINFGLFFRD